MSTWRIRFSGGPWHNRCKVVSEGVPEFYVPVIRRYTSFELDDYPDVRQKPSSVMYRLVRLETVLGAVYYEYHADCEQGG